MAKKNSSSEPIEICWKEGSRPGISAESFFKAQQKILRRDGCVTNSAIVNEARPEKSPLHSEFIWDDAVAGEKYREYQAGSLNRKLLVRRKEAPMITTRHLEAVTIPATKDQPARKAYLPADQIMKDPIQRDELLSRAIREAISFRTRYAALSELAKVFAAFDEFLMEAEQIIA